MRSEAGAPPQLARPLSRPRENYQRPASLEVPLPAGTSTITLKTPFFAHRQRWTKLPPQALPPLLESLSALGISTFGLNHEFSVPESSFSPNGCVYTPERFGFSRGDLEGKQLLELRLGIQMGLDAFGRHGPHEVARHLPSQHELRQVTAITARTWPPDVANRKDLLVKVEQLRQLAKEPLSLLLSLPAYDWADAADLMATCQADGLLLEIASPPEEAFPSSDHLRLIHLVRQHLSEIAPSIGRRGVLGVIAAVSNAHEAALVLAAGADLVSIDDVFTSQTEFAEANPEADWKLPAAPSNHRAGAARQAANEVAFFVDDFLTLLATMDVNSVDQLEPRDVLIEGKRLTTD